MLGYARRLARQRETLVARCADRRAQIAVELEPFARKLAIVDRTLATLRSRPWLAGIGAAALVIIGPRALLRWTVRVLPVYSLLRRL